MFIPVVSKMIIALVWAFWMLSVDSSLGKGHNDIEDKVKKIIKVTDDETIPEYHPTYGSTVERVKEEGSVRCGTKLDFAGFSERGFDEETGLEWHGFDVDICRAVSAAIFGDKTYVEFIDVDGKTRFEYLNDGTIDMLSAATTYTFSRNVTKKLEFLPTTYYDGQGFITKKTLGVSSAKQMEGAKVCMSSTGTAR